MLVIGTPALLASLQLLPTYSIFSDIPAAAAGLLDFSVVSAVKTASAVASDLVDAGACCCWRLCYLWCPFHSRRPTTLATVVVPTP